MVEGKSYIIEAEDGAMKIVVYTAIIGQIDKLWSVCPAARGKATYICFSDVPRKEVGLWKGERLLDRSSSASPIWKVRQVKLEGHKNLRRMARHYKCLPHRYFPNADVWIWMDGNVRLTIPPEEVVHQWLHSDLATFNHPDRNCLYIEAAFCAKHGKDTPDILEAQVERYHKVEMPERWGLAETTLVIRRNTPVTCEFNESWWAEIEAGSQRDQVSFPFVCWKKAIRWTPIPGNCGFAKVKGPFYFIRHGT